METNNTIRRENHSFRGPRNFHVLAEKLDEVDRRLPAAIRAQVRPLDDRVREHIREYQTFRVGINSQVHRLQQEIQRLRQDLSNQQLNVAEHNKIFREFCFIPDSQQRAQNERPGTSNAPRTSQRAGPFVGGSRPGSVPRAAVGIMRCPKCGKEYKRRGSYVKHFTNGVCVKNAARNQRAAGAQTRNFA